MNMLHIKTWTFLTYANILMTYPFQKAKFLSPSSFMPKGSHIEDIFTQTPPQAPPPWGLVRAALLGCHPTSYFKHNEPRLCFTPKMLSRWGSPDSRTYDTSRLHWTSFICPLWISCIHTQQACSGCSWTPPAGQTWQYSRKGRGMDTAEPFQVVGTMKIFCLVIC